MSTLGWAQQAAPANKPSFAAVSNIRLEHDKTHSTLEITASRPVTPEIQEIHSPPRIVIDLPNSRVAVRSKRIKLQADKISAIRVDQFQDRPRVTRVVVDLLSPHNSIGVLPEMYCRNTRAFGSGSAGKPGPDAVGRRSS